MRHAGPWFLVMALLVAACDPHPGGARATGSPCAWGLQCVGEVCIGATLAGEPTGWTGGMCTERCSDGACPEEQNCTDLGDGLYCLPGCDESGDCRDGYVCHPVLSVCLPDCSLGWDCGEGNICSPDGTCGVDWPPLNPVGAPCAKDADCRDAWCLGEDDGGDPTGWVGGTCSIPCGPGGHCPPVAECLVLEGEAWCLQPCGGPEAPGCREGYVCDPFMHVCLPSCQNEGWDCGAFYECAADGVCMPPPPP